MRKAQKHGLKRVENNSKRQKLIAGLKQERRRELKELWQDPYNFRTKSYAQITVKEYGTPEQIKGRVKKMKNKKVKGKSSLSSLWS